MTSRDRLSWRTSSHSGTNGGQCVEVAFDRESVLIRDSKYLRDPTNDPAAQPVIALPAAVWPAFLAAACANAPHAIADAPAITYHLDGSVTLAGSGVTLRFTAAEWGAFVAGVRDGEFFAA
ncbi:DUF397 domain-containing protein [Nocardia cyriacigeorgica]|uniref:DUF397 domain-containing protein n=1 Tax=Nocardia cyriacigeorgica TaxID=135487 RepID=UPI001895BF68|nr:DUF397 domain-containing protein [Nocardia cyriacigeorgica]MBF6455150.1 DUF397 domain-containing protein [Nocardia cyriacigeorgica]MBF6479975.1 DUF397 domain-containing protein [Nocardia cyriacigeorgica]MBF6554108.1 DUF397 domain-containing protein [Nocardia cyriacigeorgica]